MISECPELAAVYRLAQAAVPDLIPITTVPPDVTELPGILLHDPDWLEERVADAGRRWDCADLKVNATLWWYTNSALLLAPAVLSLLTTGRMVDVHPAWLRLWLRPDGYLAGTRSDALAGCDPLSLGKHLHVALHPVVTTLARIGGANPRALWAVTADSLVSRALWAAEERFAPDAAMVELTGQLAAGAAMPIPRYHLNRGARVMRRSSCCLLYQVPGREKCANCPRRRCD